MTKRILSILVAVLMVMALVPMSALAKDARTFVPTRDTQTWDFEGETDGWTFVDNDGDGFNWELASVAMAGYIIPAYSGADCISSMSYEATAGALTPDNWAITPAITADDLSAVTMTFWAQAQDADYPQEHFGVAVGNTPDPDAMIMVDEWDMTASVTRDSGNWYQYTVTLNGVEGVEAGTIYFAIRHFNCSDWFYLNVDTVEVTVDAAAPVDPTEPPVDPTEPPTPPAEGNATVILNVPEDHWEDGTGYQMLLDADATAFGSIIPETGGLTSSGNASAETYAEFEYKIPENADGALTTANIVSCASVAIEIPAGVYDWCITNPTPGDRMWIASEQGNVGGRQDNYEFVAGNTYEFVVTLQGSNDAVNVTITEGTAPQPTEPVEPTEPTEPEPVEGFYFETEDDFNEWTLVDADGDNYNWAHSLNANSYLAAYEGNGYVYSRSWVGSAGYKEVLYPDNWIISPAIEVPNVDPEVTFWAKNSSSSMAETIAVYVLTSAEADAQAVPVMADFQPGTEYSQYTVDLSDYAGETVFVAFRHYNCSDMFYGVAVDAVEVWGENGSSFELTDLDRALNTEGGMLHFTNDETYPWETFEDTEYDRYAAWSGNKGVSSSTSVVTTTVNAAAGDTLAFDFMAWGEGSYTYWDKCEFIVNGVTVMSWGAYDNNEWEPYTYTFEEDGEYVLAWSYTKDGSVNPTGDYFAVDEVVTDAEPVYPETPVEPTEPPVEPTPAPTEPVTPGEEELVAGYYFEAGSNAENFTFVDKDNDGFNWEWQEDMSITPYCSPYEGEGLIHSASYDNDTYTALTPDNWAISPAIELPEGTARVTLYAAGQDSGGYHLEHFAIYAGLTADPDEMMQISEIFVTAHDYAQFEADLSDFAGETVYVAIRHFDVTDMFILDVDQVEVFATAGEPVEPTEPPVEPTPAPTEPGEIGLIAGYYFETQDQVDEWTFIGANGSNWLWSVNNPGAYDYTEYAHEGSHFIMSYSFIDYDGAYQADNWAISPAVTLPEGEAYVSFYANQANVDYPEAISVYVGLTPDPADMMLLQANVSPNTGFDDPWTNYQIDLSDYAGETIYLAFYDYNYDMYEIWIDQVEFFGQGGEPQPTEPVEPTEPPVEPTPVPTEPGEEEMIYGNYFETEDQYNEFTYVDLDGDGENWEWMSDYPDYAYEGSGFIASASYINYYGPLTPDNWAISPAVELPEGTARVTFYADGQDPSYAAENFAIYAGLTADPADMIQIAGDFTATGEYIMYEADLSDFAGETVYIAIRHYNVTDMYRFNVDQFEVFATAGGQPPVDHLWGDANGDGVVDSEDVLLMMRYAMDLQELDPENIDPWCDVNQDGAWDMTDALLIARYVNEIIPALPVID